MCWKAAAACSAQCGSWYLKVQLARRRCAAQAEGVCQSWQTLQQEQGGSWLPRGWMDGWKSSCWPGWNTCGVTPWHTSATAAGMGCETLWTPVGFRLFHLSSQQLYPIVILVLGRGEDRKVNLGLFLSAGASADLYKTIWNMAELSLLFTFPKCNLLLISSVSKIFWINLDKVPSWTVINHYEQTTVSVTQLGLSVKLPLNLTVQSGGFFLVSTFSNTLPARTITLKGVSYSLNSS